MSDDIELKFRHVSGDIGPLKVSGSSSILQVKEQLYAQWPKDGPVSTDKPSAASDLRLILGGKFLDNSETLNDLRPSMGELKADTVVTMHVIVRPAPAGKPQTSKEKKEAQQGCGCTVQ
ncbi:g6177 [Coccomyxa viridis]|uniref:G6177 protein n=1 Tax=Coccomyxa viridis TaxID=1274662 RepID=A0ABP1FZL6_9CHLO